MLKFNDSNRIIIQLVVDPFIFNVPNHTDNDITQDNRSFCKLFKQQVQVLWIDGTLIQ